MEDRQALKYRWKMDDVIIDGRRKTIPSGLGRLKQRGKRKE
jgi:hypothetical protein